MPLDRSAQRRAVGQRVLDAPDMPVPNLGDLRSELEARQRQVQDGIERFRAADRLDRDEIHRRGG